MMRGQWLGMSSWLVFLLILILAGFVFVIVLAFKPSNRLINDKRKSILALLELSKAAGKLDQQEFELRKTIILEEEDEHFENSAIYQNMEKYARMEMDSRTYLELINRHDQNQTSDYFPNKATAGTEKALEILKERYARGEIDDEEYRSRRDQLLR